MEYGKVILMILVCLVAEMQPLEDRFWWGHSWGKRGWELREYHGNMYCHV